MLSREKWMLRKVQGTIVYLFWQERALYSYFVGETRSARGLEACFGNDIVLLQRDARPPFPSSYVHRITRTGTASSSSIHDTWSSHSSAIQWHDTHPATVPWNHASWSYKLCHHHHHHIPTSKWATMHFPPRCAFSRAPSYTWLQPFRECSFEFTTEFELRCFLTR